MKRHIQNTGTRKWFGNDMIELQSEPLKALDKFCSIYGGCVLQGCEKTLLTGTNYYIAPGLVVLKIEGSYKVAEFMGVASVNLAADKAIVINKYSVAGEYQNPVDLTIAYNYLAEISDVPLTGMVNADYVRVTKDSAIRSFKLLQENMSVPVGAIVMWSGSTVSIPWGWALCNGVNGTPNLKGKFIVGFDETDTDYNTIGASGGEKRHTLLSTEIPIISEYIAHSGEGGGGDALSFSMYSTEAHENRPPYYTLAYIIKISI